MILLTGGSGILGRALIGCHNRDIKTTHEPWGYPGKFLLDITNIGSYFRDTDFRLIVHCAAYTDVLKAETEKEECYQTNVIGTRNLANLGIPMFYISTEYVFDGEKGNYAETDFPNPQNFYSLTKLLGEYESRRTRSVVARLLFKPRPFKHPQAFNDQFTSGGYVEQLAVELSLAINLYDKLPPILHIGFGKKSTYELAKETRPEVKPCSIQTAKVKLPKDTSLNSSKWEQIKREHKLRRV